MIGILRKRDYLLALGLPKKHRTLVLVRIQLHCTPPSGSTPSGPHNAVEVRGGGLGFGVVDGGKDSTASSISQSPSPTNSPPASTQSISTTHSKHHATQTDAAEKTKTLTVKPGYAEFFVFENHSHDVEYIEVVFSTLTASGNGGAKNSDSGGSSQGMQGTATVSSMSAAKTGGLIVDLPFWFWDASLGMKSWECTRMEYTNLLSNVAFVLYYEEVHLLPQTFLIVTSEDSSNYDLSSA
ncbi:hypothetical protein V8E51_013092 [Hyaloscypha variabilis]